MKVRPTNKIFLIGISLLAGLVMLSHEAGASPADPAKAILIQNNGRVKSFDAFSREVVSVIAEKESWDRKPASQVMLDALANPGAIADLKWIRVDYKELAATLGLPSDRNFFSYNEILSSSETQNKLVALAKSCAGKRDQDLRPSKLEQKAESLYSRVMEVKNLTTGETLKVIPPADADKNAWLSPYEGGGARADQFKQLLQSYKDAKYGDFEQKTREWTRQIQEATGQRYARLIVYELNYLNYRPFQWAWILYLAAFLCFSVFKQSRVLRVGGSTLLGLALFFHTYGLALRVLILSRPPVSNMYESMIFMNWVLIVVAVIFALVRKNTAIASIGSLISAIIMIYGNLLPIDSSLEVLVPVLRSNYWLTIHVLTIVSSYGVLALAMGLGHRYLILELRGKLSKAEKERSSSIIFRVIQVGVLLLGAGTVLGGVWANESWGRFWGWDPKETWALITFLGYLVIVHLRSGKKLSEFGLAMSAVLGFLLVLMTWYGVNFVLGRGLHSYGQGAGGMEWVVLYLALEILFVAWVLFRRSLK